METLYIKEQILNIVDRCFHMYASDYRNDAIIYATEMLEEIPDNSHQIEKLEADKAELLEALEKMYSKYEKDGHLLNISPSKIKSLIQKHKK